MTEQERERSEAEEVLLHPVLRLLVRARGGLAEVGEDTRVLVLPDPRPWAAALRQTVRGVAPGDTVLVLCDRALRRALLRLLVHHRWAWQRTPSVRRMARSLREAGLEVQAGYALWTSASFPKLALPLGNTRKLRWFQRSGVLGDVGRFPLLRTLTRSAVFTPVLRALSPGFALLARKGAAGGSALDALVGHASKRWAAWFEGETVPPLEPAVLSAAYRHATVFLFPRDDSLPRTVLKVCAASEDIGLLSEEFRTLSELMRIVPADLREGMPLPLALSRVDGTAVMAIGAVEGRRPPVPNLTGRGSRVARRRMETFLSSAFAWSRSLAAATQQSEEATEEELAELAESFVGVCVSEGAGVREGRAFARALGRAPIRWRPACQHGDPSVRNGLVHRGKLRFVDWSDARLSSEPWNDVAYAPSALVELAQWQSKEDLRTAALRVLPQDSWMGALLCREMERVWDYPLPISWAVTLDAMKRALRSRRYFTGIPMTELPKAAQFALLLLADQGFRDAVPWLAPEW